VGATVAGAGLTSIDSKSTGEVGVAARGARVGRGEGAGTATGRKAEAAIGVGLEADRAPIGDVDKAEAVAVLTTITPTTNAGRPTRRAMDSAMTSAMTGTARTTAVALRIAVRRRTAWRARRSTGNGDLWRWTIKHGGATRRPAVGTSRVPDDPRGGPCSACRVYGAIERRCRMSAGHDPAEAIGRVTHYFSHLGVAGVSLTSRIAVGDRIHIRGHTTDLVQDIASMEVDNARVEEAGPNDDVALKVDEHVRDHDLIFRES
jgi:hypothetical protein